MREDEKILITGANNVTADTFSHESGSQRDISNAIFTSEKIEKSDKIVDAVNKLTINYTRYELNTVTASDAQGNLTKAIYMQ